MSVLVLAAAVPLVLSSMAGSEPKGPAGTPPYALPSATGQARSGDPWDPVAELDGVAALLYVSETCPFCRAELTNWAPVGETGETLPVWIVASPGSDFEELGWVPPALRDRVVWDDEGAIAKALGIDAVPATLWVDEERVVRDQRLGRSSPERIRREYAALVGRGGRP